jgi:flagellar biosynthesis/type III secretory pathway chaperone
LCNKAPIEEKSPMPIEEMLDQLISGIRLETKLYQLMLATVDKEKDAAILSDLKSLNDSGVEKEDLQCKIQRADEQRCLVVRKLSEKLEYPYQDLTLTKIAQIVDEPFAIQLKQASAELKTVLNTLREANQQNKLLLEHSLELVRGSFNLLSGLMGSNKVYYRTGNIRNQTPAGKCICGEV